MSLEYHRRAELLMWQGDRFAAEGEAEQAARCYGEAAVQEAEAYTHTPAGWDRTRGVLAVSSVALYRKAGDLKQAMKQARMYLKHAGLPPATYHNLRAIVDDIKTSRTAIDDAAGAKQPAG